MPQTETPPLTGRRLAVPESRQLDLFTGMLETRGAEVLRCPLVAIHDAPDPAPIEAWLRDFADGGCDDLILLTGEGLRRLLGFAERAGGGLHKRFVERLADVRTITRGPKPIRALRAAGLRAGLPAAAPTTDGVIETLSGQDLRGRRVGVQLYGTDPNTKLIDFLTRAGAEPKPVAPYVYADESEDGRVLELVEALVAARVDGIAFTSSPQVKRLFSVAGKHQLVASLQGAMADTTVAAVGPVVAQALTDRGVTADLIPHASYSMKPLVRALVQRFGPAKD